MLLSYGQQHPMGHGRRMWQGSIGKFAAVSGLPRVETVSDTLRPSKQHQCGRNAECGSAQHSTLLWALPGRPLLSTPSTSCPPASGWATATVRHGGMMEFSRASSGTVLFCGFSGLEIMTGAGWYSAPRGGTSLWLIKKRNPYLTLQNN